MAHWFGLKGSFFSEERRNIKRRARISIIFETMSAGKPVKRGNPETDAIEVRAGWSDPESEESDKAFLVGSLDYWKWRKGKCEAELRRLFKLQAKIELSIATAAVRGLLADRHC